MKSMEFQLPYYKVDITLLQIEGKEDENDVAELLKSIDAKDPEYTLYGIRRGAINGGDTYRDLNNKRIVVLFYPMEDNTHRAEIYSHEKRHIEDRVLEFFNVNDIESAGLLAGFLGEKFYEFWNIVTNVETARENIFSELKESEDEKIKKAIYNALKYLETELSWDFLDDVDILDAYEWLEKQGEQKYTKKDIDDAYLQGISDTKNEIEKQYEANYQIRKDIATFIFNYKGVLKDRAEWMDYLGIKVSFGKEKSTDKNEPKFHEGNWVVTNKGDIIQIETVNPDYYIVNKGIKFCKSYVDTHWHLWTIEDAKDGDVLFMDNGAANCVFIYKSFNNGIINKYASYNNFGFEGEHYLVLNNGYIIPATKEQCDALFTKMKEAGYEWDADNKELKKIEQKPTWSEEDDIIASKINRVLNAQEYYDGATGIKMNPYEDALDWLESIKQRIGG